MTQIRKYSGTSDDHWDCYADFAIELNHEFNKLGLRDDIRLTRYSTYLEGEALGFYNYLKDTIQFATYSEMCNTLSAEFTKLESQLMAYESKKKLNALRWNSDTNVRDFADTLRTHVRKAFPLMDKKAQEDLMVFYLREKSNLQLPIWLKYDELVKAMIKIMKK